jgi:hypothetical protein
MYQKILQFFDKKYTGKVDWAESPRNPAVNGGVRIDSAYLDWADAQSINNASIVVAYEYSGVLVIFPGDIEDDGWQKLLKQNPTLFGDLLKTANKVILLAPQHGRKSGYSQSMIDYFKPDLMVISDGHGAGETDPRFRACASGLEIKGEEKKFITTKSKGRKKISISDKGMLYIHEADY